MSPVSQGSSCRDGRQSVLSAQVQCPVMLFGEMIVSIPWSFPAGHQKAQAHPKEVLLFASDPQGTAHLPQALLGPWIFWTEFPGLCLRHSSAGDSLGVKAPGFLKSWTCYLILWLCDVEINHICALCFSFPICKMSPIQSALSHLCCQAHRHY